jgi:hypothetical protein
VTHRHAIIFPRNFLDTRGQVLMGQLGLPSGTLGFVCSAVVVVCCSSALESVVELPVYSDANAQDVETAGVASSPQRSSVYTRASSLTTAGRGMSQLNLFDTDLRFHGLDVHSALEVALDAESQGGGGNATARFLTMRRVTRMALNAAVPEEDEANEDGASGVRRGAATMRDMSQLKPAA